MKKIFQGLFNFVQKNTSGFPFFLWSALGLAVSAFIIYFRDAPNVDFGRLKFVLLAGMLWFVGSDTVKKRKIFDERHHFIFDAAFYILFFNIIIHYTGGVSGGMMITLVAAMISAPFFVGNRGTILFASVLSLSVLGAYFFLTPSISEYETGVLFLQLFSSWVVVAMVKYLSNREQSGEKERIVFARKEVDFKTKELQKTLEELSRSRTALRDKISKLEQFQKLVVGRELKMIELKTQLRELTEELEKIKKGKK